MSVLKEAEVSFNEKQQAELIQYFLQLYLDKPNTAKVRDEIAQVMSSILSGHIPTVVEHVYDFVPGLMKIVPELKEHIDLVPERTNHFVGWMAYSYTGELDPDTLAGLLNDALNDYSGPVHANSVYSTNHHQNGIVFTSKEVEQSDADGYFEDMLSQFDAGEDDDTNDEDCPFDE